MPDIWHDSMNLGTDAAVIVTVQEGEAVAAHPGVCRQGRRAHQAHDGEAGRGGHAL